MKKTFKKLLFAMCFIFTINLSWVSKPNINSEPTVDSTISTQTAVCCSGPEKPEEGPVIVKP